ncbi:MAG: MbcA/ParS/Xre antitoxin family protein [bacterium]
MNAARQQLLKTFEMSKRETRESEKTEKIHADVRERLLSNLEDHISTKRLYDQGEETFGEKEKFQSWLKHPNRAMGGQVPYEMLQNEE